ncbi:hypothetical protein BD414DRAFT_495601 [Trametes punicea]|nr:hypothetical protein BD414DRAFT_495601 [Trametes punicea]
MRCLELGGAIALLLVLVLRARCLPLEPPFIRNELGDANQSGQSTLNVALDGVPESTHSNVQAVEDAFTAPMPSPSDAACIAMEAPSTTAAYILPSVPLPPQAVDQQRTCRDTISIHRPSPLGAITGGISSASRGEPSERPVSEGLVSVRTLALAAIFLLVGISLGWIHDRAQDVGS